ncbi:MAG: hypothetical protein COB19_09125 [Porticoccus sp.]|nr:MAG: hypothetical protein COB19_09125 [Porticoccus sp.]
MTRKDEKPAFQQDVHNFRAFAILGVVGAHALHNFYWPTDSYTFVILDTLFNQSTIWFAFIAGYLFQHLSVMYSTQSYYLKKLKNVFLPYLVCSIPALVASMTFYEQAMPAGFYELPSASQAFLFIVTGKHLAPFWYIPMIMVIFLLAPVLIALDHRPVFYLALPPLLLLSAFLGRDGFLMYLELSPYFGQLSKAVYLLSPYMLGMFISHFYTQSMALVGRCWIPLGLMAALFFVLEVLNYHLTPYYIFLFKVLSAPVILYFLDRQFGVAQRLVNNIAVFSFGIFFLHGYFLSGTKILVTFLSDFDGKFPGNIVAYTFFTVAIVLASLLAITVVRRIVGRQSRYLIGC